MANITAAEVNKLRQLTGAGMMDCKKALVEANGDFELAIENLRKKGQKVATNRADRDSTEGVAIAVISEDKTSGVVISLNCETDFVTKNEDFIKLTTELATLALNYKSKEDFLLAPFGNGTVAEKLIEQTGVIGEKIEIGSFKREEGALVGSYIHAGNRIATLVSLSINTKETEEVAKNIAMQVAAMDPLALNEEGVSQVIIEKEIEIAKEQLRLEGKPEAMLENIAKGKLIRFFKDNTLVNQDYIKDSKLSVTQYVQSVDKSLVVLGFQRVAIG